MIYFHLTRAIKTRPIFTLLVPLKPKYWPHRRPEATTRKKEGGQILEMLENARTWSSVGKVSFPFNGRS